MQRGCNDCTILHNIIHTALDNTHPVLQRVHAVRWEVRQVSDTSTNQSVEKSALVLAAFSSGMPLRVSDVASAADLALSTASRLLAPWSGRFRRARRARAVRLGADMSPWPAWR